MLEASHHSLIQYRLPTNGEVVPLLQIAPSKTDRRPPRRRPAGQAHILGLTITVTVTVSEAPDQAYVRR